MEALVQECIHRPNFSERNLQVICEIVMTVSLSALFLGNAGNDAATEGTAATAAAGNKNG
jgi:hypothetical protein